METKLVQTSIKKLVGIRAMLTSLLGALTSAVADLPEMHIKRRRAYAHIVAILVIIIIILIVLIILTI